ncbi:MAG TPA: WD40 repeat domain-containing protein [Trebonia sp.]|nr:WD40 repeat domain-containing protein [Trebonia sp.]
MTARGTVRRPRRPAGHVYSVAFAPASGQLAASSDDGTIHLWDTNRSCALSGSEYRVSGRPRTVLGRLGWRVVPVGRRGLPPWSRLPLGPAGTRRPWSRPAAGCSGGSSPLLVC